MKNILITGANGFLGKNLIERLVKMPDVNVMHYSRGTSKLLLEKNSIIQRENVYLMF